MYEILSYDDPESLCFPVDKCPTPFEWTAFPEATSRDTRLSVNNEPIVLLLIGAIQSATISIRAQERSPRLRVQLALLRQSDRVAAAAIFNMGNTHGKVAETGLPVVSVSTRADPGMGQPVSTLRTMKPLSEQR